MAYEVGLAFRARAIYFLAALIVIVAASSLMAAGMFLIADPTWPYVEQVFSGSDILHEIARRLWRWAGAMLALCPVIVAYLVTVRLLMPE